MIANCDGASVNILEYLFRLMSFCELFVSRSRLVLIDLVPFLAIMKSWLRWSVIVLALLLVHKNFTSKLYFLHE